MSASLEATVRQVEPAVVEIFATSYAPGDGLVPRTADLVTTQRASGSGVIVDPDGYIVTNAHVVRGAQRLRVELPMPARRRRFSRRAAARSAAEIVGIDLETDLAVIKVDERNLPTLAVRRLRRAQGRTARAGARQPARLHNSVSLGVVSAVARQLEPESPMIYVQTDASINPGSSGGPLVDLRGRLVGINTLIVSQAGGNEGLGFAAPSNIVRTRLRADPQERPGPTRRHRRPGADRHADARRRPGPGARPRRRPGRRHARQSGRADGLRPGDLVIALDGKPMENGRQFRSVSIATLSATS